MIKAIIVDNDKYVLEELRYQLQKQNVNIIDAFTNPHEAFFYIIQEKPDVVFLDIEMPGIDGFTLAIKIQELLAGIIVVFVTAFPAYELEAHKTNAIDFILKPIDEIKLKQTVAMVENSFKELHTSIEKEPFITCFRRLDFINESERVKFPTRKTRDLLAYLLCNADLRISQSELVRTMFGVENENNLKNLRLTLFRLRKMLDVSGLKQDRLKIFSDFSLAIADGVCDLVDFNRFISKNIVIGENNIEQAVRIIDTYNGEFLCEIDEPWVTEEKSSIDAGAEELLIRISLYYFENNKYDETEKYLLKLISINSVSDQGYEMLLDLYNSTRNVQKYNIYFKRYQKIMKEEFNSFAAKRYVEMYNYYDKLYTNKRKSK